MGDDWEDGPIPPVMEKELPKYAYNDEDVEDNEEKSTLVGAPAPKQNTRKSVEKKGTNENPLAEKLRQQRLVEEADYKLTTELFGNTDDEKSLDNFIPKSESDFSEYAQLISHKVLPFEKSSHYVELVKDVMRLLLTPMKAEDAKEVASSITEIVKEKLKAKEEANAGINKTAAKKPELHNVVGDYDSQDADDFI
ncbi:hypothetical protein IFM89_029828 [Coptis chinensis]|uniref:Eukaryotic translation initiation factor 3 30 kDa subunit n=1 Tax=Coptis chinensis TaxID=261450 RepID=A0A835LT79_9MAGN|nr:hypothetical protein IFM89_029828 [Coptis chinensis]